MTCHAGSNSTERAQYSADDEASVQRDVDSFWKVRVEGTFEVYEKGADLPQRITVATQADGRLEFARLHEFGSDDEEDEIESTPAGIRTVADIQANLDVTQPGWRIVQTFRLNVEPLADAPHLLLMEKKEEDGKKQVQKMVTWLL